MSTGQEDVRTCRGEDDIILEQKQILSERGVLIHNVDPASYIVSNIARDAICSMNNLQTSRDTWVPRKAIDLTLAFHYEFLQKEVKDIVQIVNHHDMLSMLFVGLEAEDPEDTERQFEATYAELVGKGPEFFEIFKDYDYSLWPINTGGHWAAVIIHQRTIEERNSVIDHVVIADPYGADLLPGFVWARLKKILSPERGFTFAKQQPDPLWIPYQIDEFSCGMRCYEVLKEIMLRINDAFHRGVRHAYDHTIWKDMRTDVQPDKIRAEMIGVLAYMAIYHQNFDARLCVATFESLPDPYMPQNRVVQRKSEEAQLLHDNLWAVQIPRSHPNHKQDVVNFNGGGPRW